VKNLIVIILSLVITTGTLFASEVESCQSYALAAPARDGYSAASNTYSAEVTGELRSEIEITYYINLKPLKNEAPKIAAVVTTADCNVLRISYFTAQ
jgi:hypothetical protein